MSQTETATPAVGALPCRYCGSEEHGSTGYESRWACGSVNPIDGPATRSDACIEAERTGTPVLSLPAKNQLAAQEAQAIRDAHRNAPQIAAWERDTEIMLRPLVENAKALSVERCANGEKAGYEAVSTARKALKKARCDIEARREFFKRPLLEAGKLVDDAAKRLTEQVEAEEKRLQAEEKAYETRKKEEKAAATAAKEAKRAERMAQVAELFASSMPESVVMGIEDAEWAAMVADARAKKEEREAEQRRKDEELAQAREALAKKEAAEKQERERVEAERLREETARRLEAKRIAEAPDLEQMVNWARNVAALVQAVEYPHLGTQALQARLDDIRGTIMGALSGAMIPREAAA